MTRQPPQVWRKYVKLSILEGLKMHWELAIATVLKPVCRLAKLPCEALLRSSHHPVKHTQEALSLLSNEQPLKHRQNWLDSWVMRGGYKYRFPHLPLTEQMDMDTVNTYGSLHSEATDIVCMHNQVKINLSPASVCIVGYLEPHAFK